MQPLDYYRKPEQQCNLEVRRVKISHSINTVRQWNELEKGCSAIQYDIGFPFKGNWINVILTFLKDKYQYIIHIDGEKKIIIPCVSLTEDKIRFGKLGQFEIAVIKSENKLDQALDKLGHTEDDMDILCEPSKSWQALQDLKLQVRYLSLSRKPYIVRHRSNSKTPTIAGSKPGKIANISSVLQRKAFHQDY